MLRTGELDWISERIVACADLLNAVGREQIALGFRPSVDFSLMHEFGLGEPPRLYPYATHAVTSTSCIQATAIGSQAVPLCMQATSSTGTSTLRRATAPPAPTLHTYAVTLIVHGSLVTAHQSRITSH